MKSKHLALLILVSLLPLISLFITPKLIHTHDGVVHLARIAAYKKALWDGEFPVRWAGDLNYGYGMPLFNFIYQLPYFVASAFIAVGFGLVNAFKFSLVFSFLLSGATMFLFAREFFKDEKMGLFVALLYQFAPYHLSDLLIRGDFAELYAFAFIPLVLYFLTKLFEKQNTKNFLGVSFSTALLVVSHNSLSLLFFGISCFFVLFFGKKRQAVIKCFLSLLLGIFLSAFYWIPAILEHKYTYGDLFMKNMYLSHFPPIINFFVPNFFNDPRLSTGGVPIQIGIFHVIGIISALILLFRKIDIKLKKIIIFSLCPFFAAFFFMLPISKEVWQRVDLLRQFQFPWRFLSVILFTSSIISVSLFSFPFFKKKIVYVIFLFLAVFSTAFYWKPPLGLDSVNENSYWNYPLNTTYFGETDLIWAAGQAYSYPKARVEVIDKQAVVTSFEKKTITQKFEVDSPNGAKLVDHTQYYPGWEVLVDGKNAPIEFQYRYYPGQLVFVVPPGKHNVVVRFGETKLRFLSDMISLLSFLSIVLFVLFKKVKSR